MKLKEIFLEKFKSNNIEIETSNDLIKNFLEKNTDYDPYLNSFFRWKFNLSQINEKYSKIYDFTGILKYNNQHIAFWPFTFIKDNNEFTSYGRNLLNPLFTRNLDNKIESNICKNLLKSLFELANEFKVKKLLLEDNFTNTNKFISNWHNINLNYYPDIELNYHIYTDLSLGYENLKSLYRKSYKSLINKTKKEFVVKILDPNDFEKYIEFKNLHKKISGRQTRSDKSWELHFNAIQDSKSYLFYIENKTKMIGGSIINCTKKEAFYGVGVYDRDFFNNYSLSHLIQDEIIQFLCKKKFKFYNLGEYNPSDHKSEKKLNDISKFKMGFKTYLIPKFIFTHNLEI